MKSMFQLVPKMLSGLGVRVLRRTLEYFHSKISTKAVLRVGNTVMLEYIAGFLVLSKGKP